MANNNNGFITRQRFANTQQYSDLDLDLIPHPASKDLIPLTGKAAVVRAIRNILYTDYNERLFNPQFGGNIKPLLFDNPDPSKMHMIKLWITNAIEKFEPRASISNVDVSLSRDELQYNITISFSIDSISEFVDYQFSLERLR